MEPEDKPGGLGLLLEYPVEVLTKLWAACCAESVLKEQIYRQTAAHRL